MLHCRSARLEPRKAVVMIRDRRTEPVKNTGIIRLLIPDTFFLGLIVGWADWLRLASPWRFPA